MGPGDFSNIGLTVKSPKKKLGDEARSVSPNIVAQSPRLHWLTDEGRTKVDPLSDMFPLTTCRASAGDRQVAEFCIDYLDSLSTVPLTVCRCLCR